MRTTVPATDRVLLPVHPCTTVEPSCKQAETLFPGYVFGYVDLDRINLPTPQWMPGASIIVSFVGIPGSVPEHILTAVRKHVEEINTAGDELFHGLKPGDTVTIQDGPFSGYDAIFDSCLSGEERVRVLLKLLNKRQIPLGLLSRQMQRKKR